MVVSEYSPKCVEKMIDLTTIFGHLIDLYSVIVAVNPVFDTFVIMILYLNLVNQAYSSGTKGLLRYDGASIMGGSALASSVVPAGKGKSSTPFGRTFSYNPFA